MPSLDHKIPPPLVGALVAGAMWGVSTLGPQFDLGWIGKYVVPVVLVVVGVVFELLGILAFLRSRTTVNPLRPERASAIVTSGVYRVTRNPMYLGMAILLLAWALHLGALLPLAGPALFVLYITRFQIQPEERALKQIFGDEYAAYAARVRRWL